MIRRLAGLALAALALTTSFAACSSSTPTLPPGEAIGQPIAPRAPLALATVQSEPAKYFDQTLLVAATVTNVCRKKGCWMQVADGAEKGVEAMVRWESGCGGQYAFPVEAIGRRVLIQGSFYRKQISEADAAHLASESGGQPIARETYELNASGVLVVAD